MKRRALITGITGQDGSYLAELLLSKGYEVFGIVRRAAENPEQRLGRLRDILDGIRLHAASLESCTSIYGIIEDIRPHECYHLASQRHFSFTFDEDFSTLNTNINSTHFLLSAMRKYVPNGRFYFAGCSDMFGKAETAPQQETTCFHPLSSYGISKVAGYELTCNYRETHGLYACAGILFNHESPRRGFESVSRRITAAVAAILAGKARKIRLGNLRSKQEWGHARDYVEGMWRMLQQPVPEDFVIATGESHSVQEFAKAAFRHAGLDWREHVEVDERSPRPAESSLLCGNFSKARTKLGWAPRAKFIDVVTEMVEADCAALDVLLPVRPVNLRGVS
jgi:GDPmannose 4,6-dehydratase